MLEQPFGTQRSVLLGTDLLQKGIIQEHPDKLDASGKVFRKGCAASIAFSEWAALPESPRVYQPESSLEPFPPSPFEFL